MLKRWYDSHPSLSMAISLLQNTPKRHREYTIQYILSRLRQIDPKLAQKAVEQPQGFWQYLQKRRTMDTSSWMVIENLQFLNEHQKNSIAQEIISAVYLLETYDTDDLPEFHLEQTPVSMAV